ncbi:hypothetical protein EJ08DRAFT_588269 [Tothia fuscella]|uniref:Rhodopsin domain-containing protein n=1 Tax=Tothia fuscella TaxID=1048955 RepID=A0A9P4NSR7_9PEZI|nr:hypothetical protein EJ08DRAFT_588269 [Tothia fuscella]
MVIYTLEIIINADFPTPNWVDPVTRGPALYYVNSVFLCLATLSVALRLYTRIWIRNWFGWDDAFVVIALVRICAVTACVFLGYHEFGWDRHIYDIPYDKIQATGQTYYAVKLLWPVASCSVRLSIACLYYRLLKHCELDKFRWILHLNTGFIVAVLFVQMFTSAFACCRPVYDIWVWPRPSNPNCLDDDAAILAGAVLNTVSEFIMAALPIPAVFYLGVRGRQRWAVISILSIGFLVSIVGAVRIFFIWKAFTSLDQSWWAAPHVRNSSPKSAHIHSLNYSRYL